MQFKAFVFASLAAVVVAQATTTSSAVTSASTCAAQNVLDLCVSQTKGQVNNCPATDWDCLCTAWGVVLTCYNNCPGDAGVYSVQQSRDQYCIAASAYGTKTASSTVAATTTVASTLATSTSTSTNTRTSSATTSASTAASTHNDASTLHVGSSIIAVGLAGLAFLV